MLQRLNQFERNAWFLALYRLIVPRAKIVTRLIQTYAVLVLSLVFWGAYVFWVTPERYFPFFDGLARELGQIAALLYCLTLVPGMLRRFQLLPLTRAILMLWRRYVGIAMFNSALVHLALIRVLPVLLTNPRLLLFANRQILFGALAVALLFPLWLTSNEYSVRRLGAAWHWIHKLTYAAVFFIFFHVALSANVRLAWFVGMVLLIEILSWFAGWLRSGRIPAEGGNPPAAPAA
jgi:sulfoxide reductase heme-binding subunit YedZ